MVDVATLGLSIESGDAVTATDRLGKLTDAANKAEKATNTYKDANGRLRDEFGKLIPSETKATKATDDLGKETEKTAIKVNGLKTAISAATGFMAAFASAMAVRALVSAADQWSDLSSRVGLAAGSMEAGEAVMRRLNDISKITYSSMNTTAESFLRASTAMREMGYSTNQTLDYTEALNNAMVVSGAKGDRAERVATALGKAMAGGALRGEELNTIIENGGRVSELLAAEMGITTLQLREMGKQGKITGDVIYDSLVNNIELLREEAGSMDATIADAGQRWADAFLFIVGSMDQATSASSTLANVLVDMANALIDGVAGFVSVGEAIATVVGPAFSFLVENLGTIAKLFGVAAVSMAVFASPAIVASVWALATALMVGVVGGIRAIGVAMAANPLGLLISAIAFVVTALFAFREDIKNIIGIDLIDIFRRVANAIVGSFVGAFYAAKALWETLPEVMIDIGTRILNFYIGMWQNMANFALRAFNTIIDGANAVLSFLGVSGLASAMGLGSGTISKMAEVEFGQVATAASGALDRVSEKMGTIFNDAINNDYFGGMAEDITSVATAAGEATSSVSALLDATNGNDPATVGGGGIGGKGKGGGGQDKEESRIEKLRADVEALRESFLTEEQLLIEAQARKVELIAEARAAEILSAQEHAALLEDIEREHQQAMSAIQLQSFGDALGASADFFGALGSVMEGGNDTILRIQKVAGAAQALVNAWIAASQVLADPTVPFWGKFAAVAAVVAKGLGIVSAIRSGGSSAGGGGGGSASSAARPQTPAATPESTKQAINIHLDGEDDFLSKKTVVKLMESINELNKDGHLLIVSGP